jgi:DNA replication protein DnaC
MLDQQTIDKMASMKLAVMARVYKKQLETPDTRSLSFEERFGMLVDAEWNHRADNRIKKALQKATLRIPNATLADLDYDPIRKIDRGYVARLADCSWIREHRNMIITGSTGCGKTYLSCAFATMACQEGWKVKYVRVNRLLTDLAISRGDGSYSKRMNELKKIDLIVLDDFGMNILDPISGRDLLEVVEDRSGYRSMIISGQLPVSHWHGLFEDSTIADAVLDRLVHNAHRFELVGPSMRRTIEKDLNPDNSEKELFNIELDKQEKKL